MLYIIIGLPGVGKSTVSQLLAKKYDAVVLNADEFRRELFDIDATQKDQIFSEEQRNLPYKAIFLTARQLIKQNIAVIIDASLYSNRLVSEARSITSASKVIQIICPENIVKERLMKRINDSGNIYLAGSKVYDFMKSITEEITGIDYIIDTSKTIEPQLKKI